MLARAVGSDCTDLLSQDLLHDTLVLGAELRLDNRGDGELTQLDLRLLCQFLLFLGKGHLVKSGQMLRELLGFALRVIGVLPRYGNDPADALGNAAFFQDDELFDLACVSKIQVPGVLITSLVLATWVPPQNSTLTFRQSGALRFFRRSSTGTPTLTTRTGSG